MPRKRARSAASSSRKSATRASNARKRHTDRVAARQLRAEKTALTNQVRALRDAQKSLEQTRAHYSGLYDFAPVTYALIDRTGNVLSVNLAATRFLNVDRAHLIGFPLSGFVTPQDRGELLDHFRRSRFAQGIVESEVRFAVAGGSDVTCRLYTKRALHEGVDTFPTIIVDQTDRIALDDARLAAERRKEEAEQASELARAEIAAKDKFLATVSHELRTPLTPALFAASRLATWSGLPEPAQKLAATIRRNIEFEAHLIDDLLDIARINRDSLNLRLETVDVHDVLNEAVGICSGLAEPKGITITTHLTASAHHVKADRVRLRQVFWNLLNNAIKFTENAGRITIRTADVSNGMLRASVHDTGIGIESEAIDHLFAPFDRRPPANQSRAGLGLGLAICKGIVGAHHGQLWAESEGQGLGSTFAVELTTVPAPQPAKPPSRSVARQNLPNLEPWS